MKLTVKILFLFTFFSQMIFGQNRKLSDSEYEDSTVYRVFAINSENCDGLIESYECDLKNKNLFLFIPGSIVSLEHKNDKRIEKKYGIYFHDYGCVTPNKECLTEYNKMVFKYLVENYDDKWAGLIRNDLFGFNEWKEEYKTKK